MCTFKKAIKSFEIRVDEQKGAMISKEKKLTTGVLVHPIYFHQLWNQRAPVRVTILSMINNTHVGCHSALCHFHGINL
jgi:hypothetical protein